MSTTHIDHAEVMTELRAKQQQVWSSGDYNRIAALTVAVNETLVASAEIAPREDVLDVATGTGHAALAAARIGARVTGIDYVPALLDIARQRAAAERLDVDFVEASAEQLPFADGSFDVAVSAIGVMFAADHDRAAAELVRVVRPGGRIAVASWTRSGFVGGILGIVGRHVSPPPGAQSPVRWGEEDVVAELLGGGVETGRFLGAHRHREVPQRRGVRRPLPDLLRPHLLRGAAARRPRPRRVARRPRHPRRGERPPGRRRPRDRLGVPDRPRHPPLTTSGTARDESTWRTAGACSGSTSAARAPRRMTVRTSGRDN